MPLVVPVKFTYASRDLWFDPQDLDILEADYAICSTERGTEIGLVTADPFEVPQDEIGQPLKPVLRVASDIDLQLADDLAIQGDEAMVDFRRLVKELDLEMKPVGVEYLFGGEKAVFYFAAEERVDFRQLVKDLSSTLHIRVDMRQIGVRDETRLVGGYAQCGQELCCTRFGGQFEPVSIRMAKEQDLPLNSSKISGVCGRLMCCLRYEFEAYKDFKSRAPKKKTLIDTPLGKARIQEYDTPREQLVLRLENGKVFKVNLADMTCSEGCKKKAAEQGCNCRPDCVTCSSASSRPRCAWRSWSSIARTASTWAMACRAPTVLLARRCPSAVVAMPIPMLAPVRGRARVVAAERAVAMPQRLRPRRPLAAVAAASVRALPMPARPQPRARTPLASARLSSPSSKTAAVA